MNLFNHFPVEALWGGFQFGAIMASAINILVCVFWCTDVLPNQTWVCSPSCSKANLLTPSCAEGKCSVYCKTKQGVQVANAQKAQTPWWLSGKGFILLLIYLFGCTRFWLRFASSLVATRGLLSCGMQTLSCSMHVGSSSLTRDWTWVPCIGSAESYPLHHQGSPSGKGFKDRVREGGFRVRGQVVGIFLMGWWWGNWESTSSSFWFQLVWGLCASGQHAVNFFHLVGVSVSAKWLKGHSSEYYL